MAKKQESSPQRKPVLGSWPRISLEVAGLGSVELAPPTVGQVAEAERQAAAEKDETAQGDAFSRSLLKAALRRPELRDEQIAGLDDRQGAALSRGLALALGCEEEFGKQTDDVHPGVRLRRAHRERWRKVMAEVSETFGGVKEAVKGLAPKVSPIVEALRLDVGAFGTVAGILKDSRLPPLRELFLPTLRAARLDSPVLYPPTSVWREEPPPADVESVDPQQQRWMKAYEMVMHVETSLRSLIESALRELHGEKWWKRGVPGAIRKECERRKADKEAEGDEGHDPLTYSYIDELRQIILKRDNWRACFQSFFPNTAEAEVWMNKVSEYRQPTMHFRALSEDDFLFLTAACRWLLLRL